MVFTVFTSFHQIPVFFLFFILLLLNSGFMVIYLRFLYHCVVVKPLLIVWDNSVNHSIIGLHRVKIRFFTFQTVFLKVLLMILVICAVKNCFRL